MTILSLRSAAGVGDLTPDEARGQLQRELLRPEYTERGLLERLLQWFERQFAQLTATASDIGPLSYLAASALALVFVIALALLVTRFRREARSPASVEEPWLEPHITAEQWRSLARAALEQGHDEAALVDAFRALAVRQVELGRIEDVPGATAHEVADQLSQLFEAHSDEITAAAALFDRTLYGDQQVRRPQAEALLALESRLAGTR